MDESLDKPITTSEVTPLIQNSVSEPDKTAQFYTQVRENARVGYTSKVDQYATIDSQDKLETERQAVRKMLLNPSDDFSYFGSGENLRGQKKDLRELKRLLIG